MVRCTHRHAMVTETRRHLSDQTARSYFQRDPNTVPPCSAARTAPYARQ